MKRSLNILTVLILLVLCFSVFEFTKIVGSAAIDGFNAGYEACEESKLTQTEVPGMNMKALVITPTNFGAYKDSIYNEATSAFIPAHFIQVAVDLDNEVPLGLYILKNISFIIALVAQVLAIIWFIKLIVAINRGSIFCWKNVKGLRKLGVVLIIAFVCNAIPHIISLYNISDYFSLSNYNINYTELISTMNLTLGLISLIVAQVFAMGLKLQEEQELTI